MHLGFAGSGAAGGISVAGYEFCKLISIKLLNLQLIYKHVF